MSVYCIWGEVERTIIMNIEGDWTWQEYDAAEETMFQMIDEVKNDVVMIADFSNAGKLPPGTIRRATIIMDNYHPAIETTVVIAVNPVIKITVNVLKRLFPPKHPVQRVEIVDKMDTAYEVIREKYRINEK